MFNNIVATRNLFVNTDNTLVGDCRDTTLNLPQGLLECNENQNMRLTLNSFAMRHCWYRLNQYNTTFYIVAKKKPTFQGIEEVISARVKIKNGNYDSFTGLAGKINEENGILNVLTDALKFQPFNIVDPDVDVKYDLVTNLYKIKINTAATGVDSPFLDVKFVTFTIPNYNSSSGSLIQKILGRRSTDAFSSTFEVLGGCYEKRNMLTGTDAEQFDQLVSMFSVSKDDPGTNMFTMNGHYNASLMIEENIYLRTNLQSSSFQTSGFDTGSEIFPNIIPSQILAKIPLNNPTFAFTKGSTLADPSLVTDYVYQRPYELINFRDNGNNMYSQLLQSTHISQLRLFITDSYGRLIPEISPEQIKCNGMSFTASLRIDVFQE